MLSVLINSIEQIPDIQGLTWEDVNCKYDTGSDQSKGKRKHKVFCYRNGIQTVIGDIELSVWKTLIKNMIALHKEQQLYTRLWKYEMEHGLSCMFSEENVLKLFASRIFNNPRWVDYLPFNREYRPEVVAKQKTVVLTLECCKKPVELTCERYELDRGREAFPCTHCGRWSKKVQE